MRKNDLYFLQTNEALREILVVLQAKGYEVTRVCCVDMFPGTTHVETVILMTYCGSDKK